MAASLIGSDDSTRHVSTPTHRRLPITRDPTPVLQVQRLPGWYKQRDEFYYPAWAYVFPTTVLRIPYSLLVATMWSCVTYYTVGLAPEASRCAAFGVTSTACACHVCNLDVGC